MEDAARPPNRPPGFQPKIPRGRLHRGNIKLDPSEYTSTYVPPVQDEPMVETSDVSDKVEVKSGADTPTEEDDKEEEEKSDNEESDDEEVDDEDVRRESREDLKDKIKKVLLMLDDTHVFKNINPEELAELWELEIWADTELSDGSIDDYQADIDLELRDLENMLCCWHYIMEDDDRTGEDMFADRVYIAFPELEELDSAPQPEDAVAAAARAKEELLNSDKRHTGQLSKEDELRRQNRRELRDIISSLIKLLPQPDDLSKANVTKLAASWETKVWEETRNKPHDDREYNEKFSDELQDLDTWKTYWTSEEADERGHTGCTLFQQHVHKHFADVLELETETTGSLNESSSSTEQSKLSTEESERREMREDLEAAISMIAERFAKDDEMSTIDVPKLAMAWESRIWKKTREQSGDITVHYNTVQDECNNLFNWEHWWRDDFEDGLTGEEMFLQHFKRHAGSKYLTTSTSTDKEIDDELYALAGGNEENSYDDKDAGADGDASIGLANDTPGTGGAVLETPASPTLSQQGCSGDPIVSSGSDVPEDWDPSQCGLDVPSSPLQSSQPLANDVTGTSAFSNPTVTTSNHTGIEFAPIDEEDRSYISTKDSVGASASVHHADGIDGDAGNAFSATGNTFEGQDQTLLPLSLPQAAADFEETDEMDVDIVSEAQQQAPSTAPPATAPPTTVLPTTASNVVVHTEAPKDVEMSGACYDQEMSKSATEAVAQADQMDFTPTEAHTVNNDNSTHFGRYNTAFQFSSTGYPPANQQAPPSLGVPIGYPLQAPLVTTNPFAALRLPPSVTEESRPQLFYSITETQDVVPSQESATSAGDEGKSCTSSHADHSMGSATQANESLQVVPADGAATSSSNTDSENNVESSPDTDLSSSLKTTSLPKATGFIFDVAGINFGKPLAEKVLPLQPQTKVDFGVNTNDLSFLKSKADVESSKATGMSSSPTTTSPPKATGSIFNVAGITFGKSLAGQASSFQPQTKVDFGVNTNDLSFLKAKPDIPQAAQDASALTVQSVEAHPAAPDVAASETTNEHVDATEHDELVEEAQEGSTEVTQIGSREDQTAVEATSDETDTGVSDSKTPLESKDSDSPLEKTEAQEPPVGEAVAKVETYDESSTSGIAPADHKVGAKDARTQTAQEPSVMVLSPTQMDTIQKYVSIKHTDLATKLDTINAKFDSLQSYLQAQFAELVPLLSSIKEDVASFGNPTAQDVMGMLAKVPGVSNEAEEQQPSQEVAVELSQEVPPKELAKPEEAKEVIVLETSAQQPYQEIAVELSQEVPPEDLAKPKEAKEVNVLEVSAHGPTEEAPKDLIKPSPKVAADKIAPKDTAHLEKSTEVQHEAAPHKRNRKTTAKARVPKPQKPTIVRQKTSEVTKLSSRITTYQNEWCAASRDGAIPRVFLDAAQALFNVYEKIDKTDNFITTKKLGHLVRQWDALRKTADTFRHLSSDFSNESQHDMLQAVKHVREDSRCKQGYLKMAAELQQADDPRAARRVMAMAEERGQNKEKLLSIAKSGLDNMVQHYRAYYDALQHLQTYTLNLLPMQALENMAECTLADYRGRIKKAHKAFNITFDELPVDISDSEL